MDNLFPTQKYRLYIKKAFLWHFLTWGDKTTIERLYNDIREISPDIDLVIRPISEYERIK
jgi:hypothetical protein